MGSCHVIPQGVVRTGLPSRTFFLAYHIVIMMPSTPRGTEEASPAISPGVRPPDDVLELDGVGPPDELLELGGVGVVLFPGGKEV